MMKFLSLSLCLALAACTIPGGYSDGSSSHDSGTGAFLAAECRIAGCSSHLCVDADSEDIVSTCEWTDAYACYRNARCEKQADGHCGWTMTSELSACLLNPPEETEPSMAH